MSTTAEKIHTNEVLYRDCKIDRIDEPSGDDRKIEVSFSSEEPYRRAPFFGEPWIEILGHNPGEVDLTRLNTGASVHYNHSRMRADRIGVVLDARVVDGKGRATIQLSNREDIEDIWVDVRDKVLQNVSVGYKIHERVLVKSNDEGPDEYRVTLWEPVELSLVDIPADPTVGVGRNAAFLHSPRPGEQSSPVPTSHLSGDSTMAGETGNTAAIEQGRRLANERVVDINQAFHFHDDTKEMRALHLRCLNDPDVSIDAVRTLILEEIGKNKTASGVGHFQPGHTADGILTSHYGGRADFASVATEALLLRCGVGVDNPSVHAQDLRHMSLMDIARACISQAGVPSVGKSVSRVLAGAMTTSDFPLILGNVGEKLVLAGFNNPEVGTHRIWTGVGSHRDFKETSHIAVSETPGLELIGEGGEYRYGVLTETGDKVKLATYGKIMALSRQAIINDDIGLFTEAFLSFGNSAVRNEANLAYVILTSNPLMSDGVALFDAAHNNIGTSGAPSVSTLGEARKLMRNQMGLNGEEFIDPQPFALIVPTSLETVAEQLLTSLYDPAGVNQQTNTPEFIRRLRLVADPRLDADSTAQWYLTANPNTFNWVQRIYLDGQVEPFVEEKAAWQADQLEIKCRHDVAVHPFLFQGAVRNAGV